MQREEPSEEKEAKGRDRARESCRKEERVVVYGLELLGIKRS